MNKAIGDLVDQYRFTSLSGTQIVERGTVVRNVDDGQNYMFRGDMEDLVGSVLEPTNTAAAIAAGLGARLLHRPAQQLAKQPNLSTGDIVLIDDTVCEYLGDGATLDLTEVDFEDQDLWQGLTALWSRSLMRRT